MVVSDALEVTIKQSKILVINIKKANIIMKGEQLEKVDSFKYLGAIMTKDGRSISEVKSRLAIGWQHYQ